SAAPLRLSPLTTYHLCLIGWYSLRPRLLARKTQFIYKLPLLVEQPTLRLRAWSHASPHIYYRPRKPPFSSRAARRNRGVLGLRARGRQDGRSVFAGADGKDLPGSFLRIPADRRVAGHGSGRGAETACVQKSFERGCSFGDPGRERVYF
ncbi:hypothetical protein FB451DRAFT_154597, partial [Mycena latifolia]